MLYFFSSQPLCTVPVSLTISCFLYALRALPHFVLTHSQPGEVEHKLVEARQADVPANSNFIRIDSTLIEENCLNS